MRLAIITCADTDVDADSPILLDALTALHVEAALVVWNDPSVDWSSFDLNVIRSTWDYATQREAFCSWARETPRLRNNANVIAWNTDKHYMQSLAAHNVPLIPTTFLEVGEPLTVPHGEFVVKPAVGAGSMGADRFHVDDVERARAHVASLHADGRSVMVQPYVDAIDTEGELALIFSRGQFLHAMRKGAMLRTSALDRTALFRAEQMERTTAPDDALLVAHAALAACGFSDLLYARVDLVRYRGEWVLMELELTEPSLFLSYSDEATARFARDLVAEALA
jgi:glutathione synthase/RimK-type ligase-like ATP-grasp enzyme